MARIDKGGQGEVFRVHTEGEPERALKKFNFGKGDRAKQARQRFRRELEALQTLNAPGLLRLVEANEGEGWIVTPLYPANLANDRDRFRGNALASLVALRPIIKALAALHEKGGVHRDIKPANIFVDTDGSL